MSFDPKSRDEALHVLRSLKGPVRSQPGCTRTLLMRDICDDRVLTWISRWESREALDRHIRSRHFRRILAVMEIGAEPPDIEFESPNERWGLDLISDVLGVETRPQHNPQHNNQNTHKGES